MPDKIRAVKTLIIAEAGVNHNGDLDLARKLIEIAADSGADFVKFQSFNADNIVTKLAPKANYQILNDSKAEPQHQMLKKLELSEAMHLELFEHARRQGIGFISTAFDSESADLLHDLGQQIFKIPSGELTNTPLLRHIGGFGKKVILSTGMSIIEEIHEALATLSQSGTLLENVTVLHCTSAYPVPLSEVNLLAIPRMKALFGLNVGYSDHTLGTEVAIAAVCVGATVIEKHFTLDRLLPGPDHKSSLEPQELTSMVKKIREIELILGDGVKRVTESEKETLLVARKSIVARNRINKGDIFSEFNLTTKRPGTGISPTHWDRLMGKGAHRDFEADELIDEP